MASYGKELFVEKLHTNSGQLNSDVVKADEIQVPVQDGQAYEFNTSEINAFPHLLRLAICWLPGHVARIDSTARFRRCQDFADGRISGNQSFPGG